MEWRSATAATEEASGGNSAPITDSSTSILWRSAARHRAMSWTGRDCRYSNVIFRSSLYSLSSSGCLASGGGAARLSAARPGGPSAANRVSTTSGSRGRQHRSHSPSGTPPPTRPVSTTAGTVVRPGRGREPVGRDSHISAPSCTVADVNGTTPSTTSDSSLRTLTNTIQKPTSRVQGWENLTTTWTAWPSRNCGRSMRVDLVHG